MSAKDAVSVVLREELQALQARIIAQHEAAGQKASGRTAASLRVEVSEDEGTLWGRKAFGVLETGRKPGRVPKGFVAIIKQWMSDKGIKAEPIPYMTDRPHKYTPQERGTNQLAYMIARKIRREGTQLFRKGGRADIYSNAIPEARAAISARIVELLKLEFTNIKLNNAEV